MFGNVEEIWVVVNINGKIFEDYYVSSLGRLYSVKLDKILNGSLTSKGYVMDTFTERDEDNNKIRTHSPRHRTVMYSFEIIQPEGCDQVDHINGIKTDNSLINLEWVDCKTNIKRSWENGLHDNDNRQGENHTNSKYKTEDIERACELKIEGLKNAEISRILNINIDTLWKLFTGKAWKHVYENYKDELDKVQRLSKPRCKSERE